MSPNDPKHGQEARRCLTITIVSPYLTAALDDITFYNSQTLNLSRALADRGHNIHIITISKYARCGEMFGESETVSVKVCRHFVLSPQLMIMSPRMLLSKELREADAIQVSEDYQLTSVMLAVFSKIIRKPLVVFSGVYSEPRRSISKALFRALRRVCVVIVKGASPVIVAKTKRAADYAKSSGYPLVRIGHVGVDSNVFSPGGGENFRKIHGISPDSFLVLYVGRLERYRNPKILVELLEAAANRGRDVRVLMIGTGLQAEFIRTEACRRGVSERLHMIDRLPNIEMREAMRAADAFVLPMRRMTLFNFGMVLLESMSCGTPTISTPVPAATDLIVDGKNGFIVPFEDVNELLRTVERLMDDPELVSKIGAEARSTIQAQYDWHVVSREFERAYFDAAGIGDAEPDDAFATGVQRPLP